MPQLSLLAAGFCLAVLATGNALAFDVPDARRIEPPAGHAPMAEWIKGVDFPHAKHAAMKACQTCHHQKTTSAPGAFLACRRCHHGADPADPKGFYRIWHGETERSCLGCHAKTRRLSQGNPPMNCRDSCHKDGQTSAPQPVQGK